MELLQFGESEDSGIEYELEGLIADLGLPRQLIAEDAEKGRLRVYQHNLDPKYYVDHDIFVDYLSVRVTELGSTDRRSVWQAIKTIMTAPRAEERMQPEELKAVVAAIDREISKC